MPTNTPHPLRKPRPQATPDRTHWASISCLQAGHVRRDTTDQRRFRAGTAAVRRGSRQGAEDATTSGKIPDGVRTSRTGRATVGRPRHPGRSRLKDPATSSPPPPWRTPKLVPHSPRSVDSCANRYRPCIQVSIQQIKDDCGAEFRGTFEVACKQIGLRLLVLRVARQTLETGLAKASLCLGQITDNHHPPLKHRDLAGDTQDWLMASNSGRSSAPKKATRQRCASVRGVAGVFNRAMLRLVQKGEQQAEPGNVTRQRCASVRGVAGMLYG